MAAEDAAEEEEGKYMATNAIKSVNFKSNMDAETAEKTDDRSF